MTATREQTIETLKSLVVSASVDRVSAVAEDPSLIDFVGDVLVWLEQAERVAESVSALVEALREFFGGPLTHQRSVPVRDLLTVYEQSQGKP